MLSYPNFYNHLKNGFQERKLLVYLMPTDCKILFCETVKFGTKRNQIFYIISYYTMTNIVSGLKNSILW